MSTLQKVGSSGLCLLLTFSCIGTDYQDDPLVDPKIELGTEQIGLKAQEQIQLSPRYFDEYGKEREVTFTFSSSNPSVVEVNARGLISAKTPGTGFIEISFGIKAMTSLQVNVVNDPADVALVKVSSSKNVLFPGQKLQLSISIQNLSGEELKDKPIAWFSENESIATVDQKGLVTALKFGKTDIHAKVSGVKSNPVTLSVEVEKLSGTFVPAGGYRAKGTANLSQENGKLILRLSQDFETSFALGTFIYLANSTNGQEVRASGLEVAEIRTNGAHTFDLSTKFPDLRITDYKFVIIYCKPAGVTFGFAEMRN